MLLTAIPTRKATVHTRVLDFALAATVLSAAAAGHVHAEPADRLSTVRLGVLVLHGVVALLLVARSPARQLGSRAMIAAALPVLLASGVAQWWAPRPTEWPIAARGVFVLGVVLAVAALATLGRSFGILPALRQVVTRGPYRVVRHPAYVGELLMVVAAAWAGGGWVAVALVGAMLPLVAMRILAEERTLSADAAYRSYKQTVPWRLCPLVW